MADDHIAFDPRVIQEFADRLYAQADSIIAQSTALATLMGAAVGYMISVISHEPAQAGISTISCAGIAGIMGYLRGREKAFKLRLDAQLALCEIYTERNTRAVASAATTRGSALESGSSRPAQRTAGAQP